MHDVTNTVGPRCGFTKTVQGVQLCWGSTCCWGTILGDGALASGAGARAPVVPALATGLLSWNNIRLNRVSVEFGAHFGDILCSEHNSRFQP